MKQIATLFCLVLLLNSCLKDEELKLTFEDFTPVSQDDGWEYSTPEAENMNTDILKEAMKKVYYQDGFLGARALVVIRNGKIVAEVYPRDLNHINEISNVQSITKSFVSVLTGIALEKGDLDSLNTRLYDIYPIDFDDDLNKREITIKHALTMKTGLDFEDRPNFLEFMQHEGSSAQYVLQQPLNRAPGEYFYYKDGDPQLVMKAIEAKISQSLDIYVHENLFDPLGISNYHWEKAKDGTNHGSFGIFMTARDLGKFGQMLLNQGNWNGQQIVELDWITQATSPQINSVGAGGQYFGYYFWINPSNGSYAARGNGGQFIHIVPNQNLVVVFTSSPSTNEYLNYEDNLMNTIINSCY